MGPIYLDYHATTPMDPRVVKAVARAMTEEFGNANSVDHDFGDRARTLVEEARAFVANLVDAAEGDVHFTSGATESLRLAVEHALQHRRDRGRPARIVVSPVEHHAVTELVSQAAREGRATVEWLQVDSKGRLDLDGLDRALGGGADLLCAMSANNEIGIIYPVHEIGRRVAAHGVPWLMDATQSVGKHLLSTRSSGAKYVAMSAHKLHGPKGVGALVGPARMKVPGTPNVPGIVGLGEACRLALSEMADDEARIAGLRDRLESSLRAGLPDIVVSGDPSARLAGSLHVCVPDVPNGAVIARLRRRVAISRGAACTTGAGEESHVLRAMRLPERLAEGALRIGLGKFTTADEVEAAAFAIIEVVRELRLELGLAA